MKMKRAFVIMVLILFVIAALPSIIGATQKEEEDGEIKIAYVCKMLTHPWFQEEERGASEKAEELGVVYIGIDANLDDEAFMQGVDNALAQGVDGLMICITDQAMGPAVSDITKEAGIPLITINDTIVDSDGNPVPHVGIDTYGTCYIGGVALAEMAKERGFFDAGNVVKVMSVDVSFKTFLHERTQGYQQGIIDNSPLTMADCLAEDNETGMFEQVLPVAQSMLNSHPEVTHWLVTGLNDDSAVAPMRVFEEAGFPIENVIACGMGGYSLSYEEFQKDHESYIAIKLQPQMHGSEGVRVLYENIVEGKPLAGNTTTSGVVVTKDEYMNYSWD